MTYTSYKFRCRVCRRFISHYGSGVYAQYSSVNAEDAPNHCGRKTKPMPFEVDHYSCGGTYSHKGGVDIGQTGR